MYKKREREENKEMHIKLGPFAPLLTDCCAKLAIALLSYWKRNFILWGGENVMEIEQEAEVHF